MKTRTYGSAEVATMNEEKTVVETQEEIDELETAAMETAEEENAEELPESDDAAENGA